jgi:hypothetical protein
LQGARPGIARIERVHALAKPELVAGRIAEHVKGIASGLLPDKALGSDPEKWSASLVTWRSADPLNSQFAWSGSDTKTVEPDDPFRQAMNDLCQVLLNTNEFIYLH